MSNYTSSITIESPADAVFAFVSNPENMPQFLPTLNEAHASGPEKVAMDGETEGHRYHAEGDMKVSRENHSMTWGSDSHHKYRGELHVTGDGTHSSLQVNLMFEPGEKMEEAVKQEKPNAEEMIQHSLDCSLQKIKELCEEKTYPKD